MYIKVKVWTKRSTPQREQKHIFLLQSQPEYWQKCTPPPSQPIPPHPAEQHIAVPHFCLVGHRCNNSSTTWRPFSMGDSRCQMQTSLVIHRKIFFKPSVKIRKINYELWSRNASRTTQNLFSLEPALPTEIFILVWLGLAFLHPSTPGFVFSYKYRPLDC